MKLREYHDKIRMLIAAEIAKEDGLTLSACTPKTVAYYQAAADRVIKDVAASATTEEILRRVR